MLKIGRLELHSPFILAPMAGVTDLPFRRLNRNFGAELAFSEMINVRSLSYKSKKTAQMLATFPGDRPLGIQLLGSEEKYILRALDILSKYRFELLDFNAACPERKVTRRGEGASLLKEPQKLSQLVRLIVKNSSVPVTLKIRSGWDRNSLNAREVALLAQDSGVSALFLHGRTKTQGYSGNVDYALIKQVRESLQIPLVASGDIFSASLAKQMILHTGCAAVAVARGALGNPWIFREIKALLEKGIVLPRPESAAIVETMLLHLNYCVDFYGEKFGVIIFRKFFTWYTKGMHKVRPVREIAYRSKSKEAMVKLIKEVLLSHCPV